MATNCSRHEQRASLELLQRFRYGSSCFLLPYHVDVFNIFTNYCSTDVPAVSAVSVTTADHRCSEASKNGAREGFDDEPGRLVAEYGVRLLSVLTTMSKARSYFLGQVGISTGNMGSGARGC